MMLKVSGVKWSQPILPEGDKGEALHRVSVLSIICPQEVRCPSSLFQNPPKNSSHLLHETRDMVESYKLSSGI